MHRRAFLITSAAALMSARSATIGQTQDIERHTESRSTEDPPEDAAKRIPRVVDAGTMRGEMLYRELGSTGVEVSVIGMGGSHLGQPTVAEDMAIRLIHEGIDRGITFLDNSWDYNEGRSEMRVGKAFAQGSYRQKAFVMTKIDGRTREVAAAQIASSDQ